MMTPLSLARLAIRWELSLWRGMYLWARKRVSGLREGDEPISYAGATAAIMWALIILNAIEIPALHIMIRGRRSASSSTSSASTASSGWSACSPS